MNFKYTKELIENAIIGATCIADVMKNLGLKRSGGSHSHLTKRIKYYNIDISHFTGKTASKGRASVRKKKPNEVLIIKKDGYREPAFRLRRVMIEEGIPYKCNTCDIDPIWNKKELRLQIDHINGNCLDNRKENLRFLCPNCHSQTSGFCGSKGYSQLTKIKRNNGCVD